MVKVCNDDIFIDKILNDELDEKDYSSRQLRNNAIKLYFATHLINAFLSYKSKKDFTSYDVAIREAMNEIVYKQQQQYGGSGTIEFGGELANLSLIINHTSTINKDFTFFSEDLFEESVSDRESIARVMFNFSEFKEWVKSRHAAKELKYIKECNDKIISKQAKNEKDKNDRLQNSTIDNLFSNLLDEAGVDSNSNSPAYMRITDDKFNLKKNGLVADFGFPALTKAIKDNANDSGIEVKLIQKNKSRNGGNIYDDTSIDISIPASLFFGTTDQYQLIANRSMETNTAEVISGAKRKMLDRYGNTVEGPFVRLDAAARMMNTVKDKANMKIPNGFIQFALYGDSGWTKARHKDVTPAANAMTAILSAGNFSVRAGYLLNENTGFKKVDKKSNHSDLLLYVLDFDAHDPETNSVNLLPTEDDLEFIAKNYGDGRVVYQKTPHGMHVFFTAPMNPIMSKNHVKTVKLRVNLDSRQGTEEGYKVVPIDVRCNNGYAVVSSDSYGNMHSIYSFNQFINLVKNNLDFEDYAEVLNDDDLIINNYFDGKRLVDIDGVDKEAAKRFIKSLGIDTIDEPFKRFVYNHTTSLFNQLIKKGTKELFEIPYSPVIDPSAANRNQDEYIIYDDFFDCDTLTTYTNEADEKVKAIRDQKVKRHASKAYDENHINRIAAAEHGRDGEYKRYKYDIATPQLPSNPHNLVATDYYEEGCRNNVLYTFALWLNKNGVDYDKAAKYVNSLNNSAKDSLPKNEVVRTINSAYNEPKGVDDNFFRTMAKCIRNNEINQENYLKIALDRDEFAKATGFAGREKVEKRKAHSRQVRVYSHYDEVMNDLTRVIEHHLFPLRNFDENGETEDTYKFVTSAKLAEYISEYRELDRDLRPTMVNMSQSNMAKVLRIAKRLTSLSEENKKVVLAGFVIDKIALLEANGVKRYDRELLKAVKGQLIEAIKAGKTSVKQLKHIKWYANRLFSLSVFNKKFKDIENINDSTIETYKKLTSYMSISDIATLLSLDIKSQRGIKGGTMIHVSNTHLYYEARSAYNKSIQTCEYVPERLANSFVDSIDYAADRTSQYEVEMQRRVIKNKACFMKHSLLTSKPFCDSNEFTDGEIPDSKLSGVRDGSHRVEVVSSGSGTVAIDINKSQAISDERMNRNKKCKIISIFDQDQNKVSETVPIDLALCC